MNAERHIQRSKPAFAQQVRNCKTWTTDSASPGKDFDLSLQLPEALRHRIVCYIGSKKLSVISLNAGDCIKEDVINRALEYIDKAPTARKEKFIG